MNHSTPLLTGPAILGVLLIAIAVVASIVLFWQELSRGWRRTLVVVNFACLIVGFGLTWHNHQHLQAEPIVGVVLAVFGLAALARLAQLAWINLAGRPVASPKRQRWFRTITFSLALVAATCLVAGSVVLSTVSTTWHWT